MGRRCTPALARAARSPYDIERFVATHNEYDWALLWQAPDIHDASLPICTLGSETLAACSADVVSMFDPSQVIVLLRHAAHAVTAAILSAQTALVETIRTSQEAAFFAEDSDGQMALGSQTTTSVYTRVGPGPFIFGETQSSSPENEVSELYEDFDRTLSNEDFLPQDMAALMVIARNPDSREKRWLQLLLVRCENTEDKRALMKLIEGR